MLEPLTEPAKLLTKYAAMFTAAREGRMKILQADEVLSDYSRMVTRIQRELEAAPISGATVRDESVEQLRQIASEFRAQKEREKVSNAA